MSSIALTTYWKKGYPGIPVWAGDCYTARQFLTVRKRPQVTPKSMPDEVKQFNVDGDSLLTFLKPTIGEFLYACAVIACCHE